VIHEQSESAGGLRFNLSVDCESTQHALQDPALGGRSTRGLGEILATEKLKGTFFVLPGDIEAHRALYEALEREGHEVGLHLHPADLGFDEFCGAYGPDEQARIISLATDRFTQATGRHPRAFCMGYASCNDHTFAVLHALGYTHGRCSIPSRVLPECVSVWAGAPLDMHYAHRFNRLLPGGLDFVNIPATLDPDSRMWGGKHPLDLRVELVDAKNHYYTIEKALKRQLDAGATLPYIQAVTHNVFEFSDARDFRRQTLLGIVAAVRRHAERHALQIIPATLAELAQEYRQRLPLAAARAPHPVLDTRGRALSGASR